LSTRHRSTQLLAQIAVEEFPFLAGLKKALPKVPDHKWSDVASRSSQVFPQEVIFYLIKLAKVELHLTITFCHETCQPSETLNLLLQVILEDSKHIPNCIPILDAITSGLQVVYDKAGRGISLIGKEFLFQTRNYHCITCVPLSQCKDRLVIIQFRQKVARAAG
jgi:hypothetical protein